MVNKLRLDFENHECEVLVNRFYMSVVVIRGKKNRIIYNSGRNTFYHKEAHEEFMGLVRNGVSTRYKLEIHEVSMLVPVAPIGDKQKGKYWCPYCQGWHAFTKCMDGYLRCPICNISDNDSHVKKFNNLWPNMPKGGKK